MKNRPPKEECIGCFPLVSVWLSWYCFLSIIIELPHGDPAHARDYRGPTLFSDHADLIPVTGDFRQVNGKEEMLVHIQDETLIYVNDGTHFQPQR